MSKFKRKMMDEVVGGGAEVEAPEVEEVPAEAVSAPEVETPKPVAAPIQAKVQTSLAPGDRISVNKLEFLKHVRRLLIGSTDRMTRNGTRRTIVELIGCTPIEADAIVNECKALKM